ncbi:hypothetical protein [Aequorivita echinoideorum]|uniref:DUF1328 domain-containing protein n=1 Tax=Aequorivita echinoideorum TaxID=1549647 RepID=A0ABS5S7A9_9FLAO|nr:hypothetical protein [Aequorivita echinoideorum]MBT0608262.1 hypothetical protein [Aequorivita echinoideorum]
MKKFTLHFLIITIISALLGFTGLDFPGGIVVRLICLFAGIGLMVSCLDSVIISRSQRKARRQTKIQNTELNS